MKLTKGETNDMLYAVSEDNFKIGTILKLIYLYGKDAKVILTMKWSQIDFKNDTICFKNHLFQLIPELKRDLLKFKGEGEYLFLDDASEDLEKDVNIQRKRVKYYLIHNVRNLDLEHKVKHSGLSITDLRRLRGQHLIMDGVSLDAVMDLYCQKSGSKTQFKRYLDYDKLMDELHPCTDLDDLFSDYTDLNIGDFDTNPKNNLNFAVSNLEGETCIINISKDIITFLDDASEELKENISEMFNRGCLKSLEILRDNEVKYAGNLSFIKY